MEQTESGFLLIFFSAQSVHIALESVIMYLLGGYFQIHLSSRTWEHIYFYFMTSTSTTENGSGGGVLCADSARKAAFHTCQATYRFL